MIPGWVYALALCVGAAFLENVFAGPGVRQQLQEIKMPWFAPPFLGWIAIGLAYYLMAFWILNRILEPPVTPLKATAVALFASVLFLNAFWNLFFFRRRQFGQALTVSVVYSALSCGLFTVLLFVDPVTALIFLPYVLYLVYANTFGYWVWRLNDSAIIH